MVQQTQPLFSSTVASSTRCSARSSAPITCSQTLAFAQCRVSAAMRPGSSGSKGRFGEALGRRPERAQMRHQRRLSGAILQERGAAGRLLEAEAVIGEHLVGNTIAQLAALTARAASRYRRISPMVGAGQGSTQSAQR